MNPVDWMRGVTQTADLLAARMETPQANALLNEPMVLSEEREARTKMRQAALRLSGQFMRIAQRLGYNEDRRVVSRHKYG